MSRFLDLYGSGTFTSEDLDLKVKPLIEQRNQLQEDLKTISNKTPIVEVRKVLSSFDEVIEKGSLENKRTIIRQLIRKIEIDNDDIIIHWNI